TCWCGMGYRFDDRAAGAEGARMAVKQIAYLTPLYFDERSCLGGGERYPLNLARGVVESSGGRYAVEIVSYGERSWKVTLQPGVTLRILAAANRPANVLDVL